MTDDGGRMRIGFSGIRESPKPVRVLELALRLRLRKRDPRIGSALSVRECDPFGKRRKNRGFKKDPINQRRGVKKAAGSESARPKRACRGEAVKNPDRCRHCSARGIQGLYGQPQNFHRRMAGRGIAAPAAGAFPFLRTKEGRPADPAPSQIRERCRAGFVRVRPPSGA